MKKQYREGSKILNRPETKLCVFFLVSIMLELGGIGHIVAGTNEPSRYLSNLPFAVPEIKEPQFPPAKVNILDYGAVNDGVTLNTEPLAKAIRQCAESGGGTVIVPPGTWLTGPIKLESNINLHLEKGAILQFSKNIKDFPLLAGYDGKSKKFLIENPIYAFRAKNIGITGEGVIDGNGQAWRYVKKDKLTPQQWKTLTESGGVVSPDGKQWWPSREALEGEAYLKQLDKSGKGVTVEDYAKAGEFLRPDMVRLMQCDGILLDGPTFLNSPRFHVHLVQSENIIVRNITIKTEWSAQNGDGLDISSCRNVLVYNSTVDAGDDAICIKPGKISERQKPGPACENIVIADCIVYHGHGGFVIGSESFGGARNISVTNCIFAGTDVGLRFKSQRGRGGLIENIYISNIQMRAIANEAILFDLYYGEENPEEMATTKSESKKFEPRTEQTPQFRNFMIKNIVCTGANRALLMNGLPEMPLNNILLDSLVISSKKGMLLIDADSITINQATILTEQGPVITVNQSANIFCTGIRYPMNAGVFLTVSGEKVSNVKLEKIDLSHVKEKVIYEKSAPHESVIIKEDN